MKAALITLPLGLTLLGACGQDSLIPLGAIASGAAVGGIGYLLGDRPEIELPAREDLPSIGLGEVKVLHFQLRIPEKVPLHQQVKITASPGDIIEVLDPVFYIDDSVTGLPVVQGEEDRVQRIWQKTSPRLKGLKLGKAEIRIEALGTSQHLQVQVVTPP
ncbi:MAG: hypothetical protein ACAI44_32845 [Candidatus Sericytochromatia bacterium]